VHFRQVIYTAGILVFFLKIFVFIIVNSLVMIIHKSNLIRATVHTLINVA